MPSRSARTARTTRPRRPAVTAFLAAGGALLALTLTACTTSTTTRTEGPRPVSWVPITPKPSPTASPAPTPAADALARHDARFPEIAALCPPGVRYPDPGASPFRKFAPIPGPLAGEPTRLGLDPASQCRAAAHAHRVLRAVIDAPEPVDVRDAGRLRAFLRGLGYELRDQDVRPHHIADLLFEVRVPESGPCFGGQIGDLVRTYPLGPLPNGSCAA
ncbi:hypothetical protein ACN20G_10820 [Streptomyces sp. BI20]|uniref:hypothetical protein n=1 Tax=Streptomyces sp. BI20 TaxID=3403460 RepID=UPI003C726799